MRRNKKQSSRGNSKISRRLEIKYDIDALLKRYRIAEFRAEEGEKELDRLQKKYGSELYDDLLKRLDQWDEDEHEGLFWILSYLGNDELIEKLWYYIGKSHRIFKPRLVALSLLQELGEDIQPELLSLQTTPLNLTDLESIMTESIQFMLDAVQNARGSDQIQTILFQLEEMKEHSVGGEEFLHFLIDATFDEKDARAADFLLAMSLILSGKSVREKARANFQKLRLIGIEPASPYIQALVNNNLYKVYHTTDNQGDIFQLTLAWERENDLVQVFVFLMDDDDILDFFVTQNISKNRFEKEFYNELLKAGAKIRQLDQEETTEIINQYLAETLSNTDSPPGTLARFSHVLETALPSSM